ncbi:MAG: hypothetical protein QXT28_07030 [Thermofilaceae archaeon]
MDEKLEEGIKTLLRAVWSRVDWRKIARGRNRYDVFAHRVKAAAYQRNVKRFLEKLCSSLSLQSVQIHPELLKALEERRDEVLKALRQETIYYIMLATEGE